MPSAGSTENFNLSLPKLSDGELCGLTGTLDHGPCISQGYNVKLVSCLDSKLSAGPCPLDVNLKLPEGWSQNKHPYGYIYYTHHGGDDDVENIQGLCLITDSDPRKAENLVALQEAQTQVLHRLRRSGKSLPLKSHLYVVLYPVEHLFPGGYYFADLQQQFVFWYVVWCQYCTWDCSHE